ncbi:Stp1/IreP family PP2C-type Ser/Thr phosphatase [Microbulbifer sp. 2205BS26-8]|uniref:Stp1/IreP family PP2C-type Ser/Thr phosphatase n=1 Tax=Microbulbifer sp. 2205BS26-8 TaxID=3064386 RepID=UPI00273FD022|nr:Stp1/IreP family PP2C-type Ser/Thr phosphatase [Microbulbifer sp. 2205BS26-8]MDP5208177.1 Stp1/IreP family PP2C-type Ser/Thr phosphatase [Microbulbifer sp. 2205BS26-8]
MDQISLAVNGRTDIGQVREENEDSIRWHACADKPFAYIVVADGMGGYTGGATASKLAAETIQTHLDNLLKHTFIACSPEQQQLILRATLIDAINSANTALLNTKNRNPQLANMGTTLVVAVMWHNLLIVAHIGDSRAYLWNNYGLQRLTRDHSVVQEMLDSGQISPGQAKQSGVRNHITRALGVSASVEAEINSWRLTENALLLLCSDGLTEYLDDHAIERVLATHRPALECVYRFIDDANKLGGRDNISAGILEYASRPLPRMHIEEQSITQRPRSPDVTVRKLQR